MSKFISVSTQKTETEAELNPNEYESVNELSQLNIFDEIAYLRNDETKPNNYKRGIIVGIEDNQYICLKKNKQRFMWSVHVGAIGEMLRKKNNNHVVLEKEEYLKLKRGYEKYKKLKQNTATQ